MRSTKLDWICIMRYGSFGGFDPGTGQTKPITRYRQEQWVKGYFRPEKTGNQFTGDFEGTTFIYRYSENNFGEMFLKQVPTWTPLVDTINGGTTPLYPDDVFIWWPVVRGQLDANAPVTKFNWVKSKGAANYTIGTRFNKFYAFKFATLDPKDEVANQTTTAQPGIPSIRLDSPPISVPPNDVTTFEQAESRLHTVIQIGDSIVNPKE